MGLERDVQDVTDTLYRYCETLDEGRREEWLDCFTTDASWQAHAADGTPVLAVEAHEGLGGMFDGLMTTVPPGSQKHFISNVRVEIDGDDATSTSYYQAIGGEHGRPVLFYVGKYADRLRRGADGRWRLADREVILGPPDPE